MRREAATLHALRDAPGSFATHECPYWDAGASHRLRSHGEELRYFGDRTLRLNRERAPRQVEMVPAVEHAPERFPVRAHPLGREGMKIRGTLLLRWG